MHQEITNFINAAPADQKLIMEKLRQLVHDAVPDVEEQFKWSRPIFRKKKDFAYLKTAKSYVTLGFFNTDKLKDPNGLLEGTGKNMRHIKIKKVADLDSVTLRNWFIAAAE